MCALGLAALAAVGGCSADVTRFNLLGSDLFLGSAPAASPAPGPAAYAPAGYGYTTGQRGGNGVEETALAPLPAPHGYRPPGREYRSAAPAPYPSARSGRLARAPDRAPPPWTDRSPPPWTDKDPFPWPDSPSEKRTPAPSARQPAVWGGRHVMSSGESLYAIARRYKVSVEDLKRVNGIADATKVWAGRVLTVPERRVAAAAVATPPAPPRVVQASPRVEAAPPERDTPAEPAPRTAARQDAAAPARAPAPAAGAARFRWPARGKMIVGFGGQLADGTKSEGINLAVPLGTDIHAAEAGRVHYAGDGLKGYGNLILIRHANGWVSTYAHADRMLVKAGDQVKRGQVIGTAGKSGPVSQPQLHFELRKGSQPVDPLPHLGN